MSGRLTGLQFQRTIASQSNEVEMIHAEEQSFCSNVLTGKEDQPMSETCSDEPTEKPSTSKFTKRNNNITTHFTDMCTPHIFFSLPNGVRRSTFDAGLVTKFGAFSSLNFPKLI